MCQAGTSRGRGRHPSGWPVRSGRSARSRTGSARQAARVFAARTQGDDMPYYRVVGDIPAKRHVRFRRPDGGLYAEELMGEEGFVSDSSLLYHVHAPTAIVKSEGVQDAEGGVAAAPGRGPGRLAGLRLRGDRDPGAGEMTSPLIDSYVAGLHRRLPAALAEEAAGGLTETYAHHLAAGAGEQEAARAALAEFGDLTTVAGEFTRQAPGRSAARLLLATGPVAGRCWPPRPAGTATSGPGSPPPPAPPSSPWTPQPSQPPSPPPRPSPRRWAPPWPPAWGGSRSPPACCPASPPAKTAAPRASRPARKPRSPGRREQPGEPPGHRCLSHRHAPRRLTRQPRAR